MNRLRARDAAAWAALVDRHSPMLLRLARTFVRTDALAQEVVQETWLGVLNGLARFEGRAAFKSWLVRILMNLASTRGLVESRTTPLSAFEGDASEPAVPPVRFGPGGMWAAPPAPWSVETPQAVLLRREMMVLLQTALAELPPAQRQVVMLHDIDGLTPAEICAALDLTPANQRVLLHRGRARLRLTLEARLGEE